MYKLKSKEGYVSVAGVKDPITKDNVDKYQYLIYKLKKSGNPAGNDFEGDEEGVEDSNGKKVAVLPVAKNESFNSLKAAKEQLAVTSPELVDHGVDEVKTEEGLKGSKPSSKAK